MDASGEGSLLCAMAAARLTCRVFHHRNILTVRLHIGLYRHQLPLFFFSSLTIPLVPPVRARRGAWPGFLRRGGGAAS